MSRIGSVGVSSCVAVALMGIAHVAFAQDPPAPVDPAAAPPPPVAQQSASRAGSTFDGPGVDFGARLGYAVPLGSIDSGDKTSDTFSGAIPVILEVGYRFNANITVGALFQYGVAQVKDQNPCGTNGVTCSGSIVRLGVEALYNFNLEGTFTPWAGIGTGYEWMGVSAEQGSQSASVGAHGFEFVNLQAGGDFRLGPQFMLGPFAALSVGQYSTVTTDGGGMSSSTDIPNKAIHEWLQLGVRGRFGI